MADGVSACLLLSHFGIAVDRSCQLDIISAYARDRGVKGVYQAPSEKSQGAFLFRRAHPIAHQAPKPQGLMPGPRLAGQPAQPSARRSRVQWWGRRSTRHPGAVGMVVPPILKTAQHAI